MLDKEKRRELEDTFPERQSAPERMLKDDLEALWREIYGPKKPEEKKAQPPADPKPA